MKNNERNLMENFDEQNIEQIRSIINDEKNNGPKMKQAYTMIQKNAPCEVNITEKSRKICVDSLFD